MILFIIGCLFCAILLILVLRYTSSEEDLFCDVCDEVIPDEEEPWHFNKGYSRHLHACDKCYHTMKKDFTTD